jgi:hypothetical protein
MLVALLLAAPALAADAPAPGPASSKAKAKQYARLCGSDAKHRRGAAECIAAMRKLASGKRSSPRQACAGLSRKRVVNGKRVPSAFARCVRAGAKLMKERKAAAREAAAVADEQAKQGAEDGSLPAAGGEPDDPPPGLWLDDGSDPGGDDAVDLLDPLIDAPDLP